MQSSIAMLVAERSCTQASTQPRHAAGELSSLNETKIYLYFEFMIFYF